MQELENFKKEQLTIDLERANIVAVVIIIPIVLIFGLPYYLLWKPQIDIKQLLDNLGPQGVGLGFLLMLSVMILGIVFHELIHGITWALFAKAGFKSIKFGVLWKMLTPYCHCKEPLLVRHYIIGGIAPAVILGLIPSIIAIIVGNIGLLLFGMLFTTVAGGDFLVVNLIRKESKNSLVQDHPSEVGCFIYRKTD